MLDRLHRALEREHRFVNDASHELRTPPSALKMDLDLALARGRAPEELETALRSASEETDRLLRLAEDPLVLAGVEQNRVSSAADVRVSGNGSGPGVRASRSLFELDSVRSEADPITMTAGESPPSRHAPEPHRWVVAPSQGPGLPIHPPD